MDLIFFLGVFREKYFTFNIMPNLIGTYIHKIQVRRERDKNEILYYPKNEKRYILFHNHPLTRSTELKTSRC